jgi:hypothetical protein
VKYVHTEGGSGPDGALPRTLPRWRADVDGIEQLAWHSDRAKRMAAISVVQHAHLECSI